MSRQVHVAIVAGEESGDLLGADLVSALRAGYDGELLLSGVGGQHLQSQGLNSWFDPSEIALMGVVAVLRRLPRLIARINQTANAIIKAQPDCVVIIDSPDFTHRVARKVRAKAPEIPIVNYVCPSVWAWRPGRAAAMTAYVDHVLAILPFEPEVLQKLGGPPATFVGHRLVQDKFVREAALQQQSRKLPGTGETKKLLVLPGSRHSEVGSLLDDFGQSITILAERGLKFEILMPTVSHVADRVRTGTAEWPVKPEIFQDSERKWQAFGQADAALAASGTVLLELALVGVPAISAYKSEPIMRLAMGMITTWTAALPNLIADRRVIPEYLDWMIRPGMIARSLEQLMVEGHDRAGQLEGLSVIAERMKTPKPSGELAAEVILGLIRRKHG